ncbi:MAG: ABC-type transport system involved in multi-copper enzyme maturation permease subunit [Cryomorphaceae bacterium]|jgi:ABC-type transport system involved in multi-copper enzyme maturation permease subunit
MATNTQHFQKTSFISLSRIWVIASHTFTQLVRMKVFYFLIAFVILLWGAKQIIFPNETGGDSSPEQELRLIKSAGFAAMNMFSMLLALSATALLIPKDIEDRTLYTILCKPVPRLDYLLGKLLGVLVLIFVSLVAMDLVLSFFLNQKASGIFAMQTQQLAAGGMPQEMINEKLAGLKAHGVTINIHFATFAIFLKAIVIASIALLISTFSSSTLFTLILTLVVIVIGLIQADAREYATTMAEFGQQNKLSNISLGVAIFFPDLQFLSIEDGVIDGRNVPLRIIGQISMIAMLYFSIYVVLSWFAFRKKEF